MNLPNSTQQTNSQAGFSLVLVLGFLFVVTLMVTPFVLQVRTNFHISSNVVKLNRMTILAEGIIEITAASILNVNSASAPTLKMNGELLTCSTERLNIALSIQDHRGLIDLNAASFDLLKFGFETANIDSVAAARYANTVIHLRSITPTGETTSQIPSRKDRRLGRFSSTLELLDIESEIQLSHRDVTSLFTVHTGAVRLAKKRAPPALLHALSVSPQNNIPTIDEDINLIPYGNVYTITATIGDTKRDIRKSLTKVAALGVYAIKPVQFLETPPYRESSNFIPTGNNSCSSVFGDEVSKLLEGISV